MYRRYALANLPVVALDNQTHTGLLPGTYSEWYTPETWPQFGQNTSYGTGTTTLSSPAVQIVFSTINYDGSGSESLEVQPNGTVTNWQSVYLPDGWYALATPGNALWTSVPDRSQLDGSSVVALGPFGYGESERCCEKSRCNRLVQRAVFTRQVLRHGTMCLRCRMDRNQLRRVQSRPLRQPVYGLSCELHKQLR
jgi:hypothetical protein